MTDQIIKTTTETTEKTSKRYRCRHIFVDGHRCGSPSLRGEPFCYYHHTTRGFADEKRLRRAWAEFELPQLEDRSSVLAAINEVLQRLACNGLPAKEAGLLLYGLQIASLNLPEPGETKSKSDDQPPVEEVIINPHYGDLAPIVEIAEPTAPHPIPEQQGASRPALEDMGEAPLTFSQSTAPGPTVLPNLNASAPIAPPQTCHPERSLSQSHRERRSRRTCGCRSTCQPSVAPSQTHVISTEGGAFAAVAERPLYFVVIPAHPSTPATNQPTANPEINTPNPAPNPSAWYPSNCHVNEKRTPRPPHSAHRYQAAQRRRPGRRHAIDGLQLA